MISEAILDRYRALGKKLEIERLRISEIVNEDLGKSADNYRPTQDCFCDSCNALLIEIKQLEERMFE